MYINTNVRVKNRKYERIGSVTDLHVMALNLFLQNTAMLFSHDLQRSTEIIAKMWFSEDITKLKRDDARKWLLDRFGKYKKIFKNPEKKKHNITALKKDSKESPEDKAFRVAQSRDKYKYDFFLKSAYWQKIRTAVFDRDDNKCVMCGSTEAIQAHHKTYAHHGDEMDFLEDLITVCTKCHRKIHGITSSGRTQKASRSKYDML